MCGDTSRLFHENEVEEESVDGGLGAVPVKIDDGEGQVTRETLSVSLVVLRGYTLSGEKLQSWESKHVAVLVLATALSPLRTTIAASSSAVHSHSTSCSSGPSPYVLDTI
ncbi:hypothetical protein HPB47_015619 [Ixodes persulcatus]|uniref:Uncharacterized protein n=1 Tax=Ixodes persulcatus TaxID=34615 RepID=A0AC60QU96_IXOPE|nr:hypothetical protein HPB47_015619 [Ixodes persulcatus]